ncbi:hypothetical protein [Sphingomonas crocodyli]|nr:hypothetical protein [Sphingomonas crocodyli]
MIAGLIPLLFLVFTLVGCAYALWRGDMPERWGVAIYLGGALLTPVAYGTFWPAWHEVNIGVFIIDMMVLAGFVMLTLHYDRYWPIWAASLQLPGLIATIMTFLQLNRDVRAYAHAEGFWAWPTLLVIVIGAARYNRTRIKAIGRQP